MLALALFVVTFSAALPGKIVAVAAAVYAVLQVLKKFIPALGGVWAVVLNVAFAAIGFIASTPAEQLFTFQTLLALLAAAAAAAGIHGTVSKLSN